MRYEQLRKFRFVMERTHHRGLGETDYFGRCNRGHRRKATRMAVQAALTEEIPLLIKSDHGFLAVLGNHGELARAVHDVKDGICQSPWRKTISFFRYFALVLPLSAWGRKVQKNEGLLPLGFSGHGSALDTCRVRV